MGGPADVWALRMKVKSIVAAPSAGASLFTVRVIAEPKGKGLGLIPAALVDAQRREMRAPLASPAPLPTDRSATSRRYAASACSARSRSSRR